MNALITKEQAAEYLSLKTPEAAEKLLARLGVCKIDFSLMGGKGIRYRRADIDEALEKITIDQQKTKKLKRPRRPVTDIFDLPIKEQMAILTARSVRQ